MPQTLTPEEIAEIVIDILTRRKAVDRATIGPDTTLISLGIDSLEGLEVIFALEDRFNISVADDEATTMKTVGAVIAGVQRIVAGRPSAPALEQ